MACYPGCGCEYGKPQPVYRIIPAPNGEYRLQRKYWFGWMNYGSPDIYETLKYTVDVTDGVLENKKAGN